MPTQDLVRAAGGAATFVRMDVSRQEDVRAAIAAGDELGGIDVLVNNAGILRTAPFLETSEADFDAMVSVNVKALFFCSQQVTASMVAAGRGGTVINLSSNGGLHGVAGLTAYCATKGAVRLLTYALAAELAPHAIRVCALHPGTIDTSMTRGDIPVVSDGADPRRHGIPMGRFGRPQDVANAAVLLASNLAGYVTGASLTVASWPLDRSRPLPRPVPRFTYVLTAIAQVCIFVTVSSLRGAGQCRASTIMAGRSLPTPELQLPTKRRGRHDRN